MVERKRLKNAIFWVGIAFLMAPMAITVGGVLVCSVWYNPWCVALPFAWMLLWWVSAIGIALMVVSGLIRADAGKPRETP